MEKTSRITYGNDYLTIELLAPCWLDRKELTVDDLYEAVKYAKENGYEYDGYHFDTGYYGSLDEFSIQFIKRITPQSSPLQ